MKTENKCRWLIWAIAILVVMNLTTLITVMYNRSQLSDNRPGSITNLSMTESSSMKYSGRYFRDELDLSMEQMKKFSEFNPEFRQAVMSINRDMAEKRHEMLIEMAKNNCDTTRLNVLSDSIGYLHAALKKSTYKYYINFKNICTQQQQKKLEQLFGEMFNSDIQMGQNGRGGQRGQGAQGGRRYGWRNKN
jgi:Spy/CpxP family protein refolding chaperone